MKTNPRDDGLRDGSDAPTNPHKTQHHIIASPASLSRPHTTPVSPTGQDRAAPGAATPQASAPLLGAGSRWVGADVGAETVHCCGDAQ